MGHPSAMWRVLHAPGCSSAWQGGGWLCGLWRLQVCLCHVSETRDLLDASPPAPPPEPWASDPGTLPGNRNQQEP